ncbi:hypothetical protein N657DRAFT_649748 [Parathielavia appendiculata]|uniref:Oxidoreductase-like protein n=1 Tax=Parathielavia appendiculata TaxID=2587402 RepID=A0AAN6TSF5_9PEZI|nr:hypothetical protein N657DRAFT_649748 [Parathielavia appendiculata]
MATRPQPEARSLSAINYLAANPPQYPYHPDLRESLTLYISRVPGTQDVILSTFRPLKNNVTAEDVASSLYYFHLDSPQDGLLAVPTQSESGVSPRSSSESARSAIPRKPLPASAKVLRPESGVITSSEPHHALAATSTLVNPELSHHPSRQSQGESRDDVVEGYRENPMFRTRRSGGPHEHDAPDLPPRPTPPAAMIQRSRTPPGSWGTAVHGDNHRPTSGTTPHRRPVTPTQPTILTANLNPDAQTVRITSPASSLYAERTPSPGKTGRSPSSLSFSLTMIRRDPASGAQWNVGKVTSFQTNVPTPEAANPNLDSENMGELLSYTHKIDIRLETAGYAKYRDMPSRADVNAYRPTSAHSFAQQLTQGPVSGPGGDQAPMLKPAAWKPAEEGFSRQVVMAYGASWTSNFKKAFQRRERSGSQAIAGGASPEDSASKPFHSRHGSTSTIGSVDSTDGRHSPTIITYPGPGLKPKGYVFLSPWNGRCEFRTSTNGRSLKCRHVLDPADAKLDPREVAQSIRDAQAMGRSRGDELSSALVGAKPVSELRFNLPRRPAHNTVSRDGGTKNTNHVSGRLSKLFHHRSRSSEEESDDGGDDDGYGNSNTPMDLSLGKENAGGGNGGKRAKLGKLIIHDEGLKMLDLVVAANIGVWWTTWGRNS